MNLRIEFYLLKLILKVGYLFLLMKLSEFFIKCLNNICEKLFLDVCNVQKWIECVYKFIPSAFEV
jgi:hypothetical protein